MSLGYRAALILFLAALAAIAADSASAQTVAERASLARDAALDLEAVAVDASHRTGGEFAAEFELLRQDIAELSYRLNRGDDLKSTRDLYRRIRHRRLDVIERLRRESSAPFSETEVDALQAAFDALAVQYKR